MEIICQKLKRKTNEFVRELLSSVSRNLIYIWFKEDYGKGEALEERLFH